MSPTLEDRLHRLADPVSASPSETTLNAVHDQTRRLRRRRQVGQGVAAGVLGVVVVAAGLSATGGDDGTTTTDVGQAAAGQTADEPAVELDLDLDLDGFALLEPSIDSPLTAETPDGGSYQVFRRPDDLLGPTIWLRHEFATDTVVAGAGQETVQVPGAGDGALTVYGQAHDLLWNPDPGLDRAAFLTATGLTRDELLAFAAGLVPTGDEFGLAATYLPAGLEEVALPAVSDADADSRMERQRVYDDGTTQVQMLIVDESDAVFEQRMETALLGCAWEEHNCRNAIANETVEVLGRPALLSVEGASDRRWHAYLRLSPQITVDLLVLDADRATLDTILAHLVETAHASPEA